MAIVPLAAADVDVSGSVNYWSLGALVLLLTGMLVLGVVVAVRLRRWLRSPSTPTLDQEAAWYQDLLQRGELSPQEYQRIMAILADKDASAQVERDSSSHIQRLDDRGPKF
jgi:hypothetical protein